MNNDFYDVIVVGAGHAGCEAALAAARMGCKTIVFTVNINNIGLMPCNPAIGGPAKGQMVSEIDALGGEMGKAADATFIQMKVLNRSRGPAVQCLRTQNDSFEYKKYMKVALEAQPNLEIKQDIIEDILVEKNIVTGVKTQLGKIYNAKTVVITAGTFLKGKIYTGMQAFAAGRISEFAAENLSASLIASGHRLGRLKTGTPPRLDARTIDYAKLTVQPGDDCFLRFSFKTAYHERYKEQLPCYLTYTNPQTHQIILGNLDRSPLYQKMIQGVGPRYCPSIEDKVVRFQDKDRHQIFLEPEGRNTIEVYAQGMNTSLPEDVQEKMLHSMLGLEKVKILKAGYAVEYDFVYPEQLKHTLESTVVENLFFAGQINGSSGYEEAAAQGLMAGINAALKVRQLPGLVLQRNEAYIGTLIDDLINKKIAEPYRMMSSRAEYRLLLRQDNAVYRLAEKGYALGLISEAEIAGIRQKQVRIEEQIEVWKKQKVTPEQQQQYGLENKISMYELVKRPGYPLPNYAVNTANLDDFEVETEAAIVIKYEGYVQHQQDYLDHWERIQGKRIPANINYDEISGLKKESREKLKQHQPATIQDALKIAGINPADVSVLHMHLSRGGR